MYRQAAHGKMTMADSPKKKYLSRKELLDYDDEFVDIEEEREV